MDTEFFPKGRATRLSRCTETWTAETRLEAEQWANQLRARGVTEVRLEPCDANEPEETTHVHMAGTLEQALFHFGMTSDLAELVFQQFEDGSEGEYTDYWPVITEILMEWAAKRGAQGLPATLKDMSFIG